MLKTYFVVTAILFSLLTAAKSKPTVVINEFMASNKSTIADETGAFEDWIELYNPGRKNINLSGYYLSDDPEHLTKFKIPSKTVLNKKSFVLFWASGDVSRGNRHTNFKLGASKGEYVILTAPNGVDIIDSIKFGPQTTDISYGRLPDGTPSFSFFDRATPNSSNSGSAVKKTILKPLVFSQVGAFLKAEFTLEISSPDSGVIIYYTLDGSEPDPDNLSGKTYTYKNQYQKFQNIKVGEPLTDSIVTYTYTEPIEIKDRYADDNRTSRKSSTFDSKPNYFPPAGGFLNKGTVVRAIATREDAISSDIVTETYFVGPRLLNHYTLPVVSLSIDENLLFDVDDGVYCAGTTFEKWRPTSKKIAPDNSPANWRREGRAYEYRMGFEYFNTDGQKEFGQLVGARIHGGFTRSRRRKSLRLYARSAYGQSTFNYPFFTNRTDDEFKRILLRNSGNDERNTQFRDAFIQNLVMHLPFDIQQSEAAIVFINGEYWGIHNIREWQNHHYIKRLYNIKKNELDFISERMDVKNGDSIHFTNLLEYVKENDLSDDALFAHVNTKIDIAAFTDYVIAQVFSRNTDWPTNNIKWWRKRVPYSPDAPTGHDGRWRVLAYDMDFGFGWHRGLREVNNNTLAIALTESHVGVILSNLCQNEDYKKHFVNRYADLMNTCFTPTHVKTVLDSMVAIYQPEINEHSARWRHHSGVNRWMVEVNLIQKWANKRPKHARNHLEKAFHLKGKHKLNVDITDMHRGFVSVNTIDIDPKTVGVPSAPYPWQGVYFQGVPIKLEAIPNTGYTFKEWRINGERISKNLIEINLERDTLIVAHFVTDKDIDCGTHSSHVLADKHFMFKEWDSENTAGSMPANMAFVYFNNTDPDIFANIEGFTDGAYNLSSRTRIKGLDKKGIGFINTGKKKGNPGFPGKKLGGAILYLNTENVGQAFVQFTGGTIKPGSREYSIRLQYRIGDNGNWHDLLDENDNPIEYKRQSSMDHSEIIGPHPLPTQLLGRECIQLMWRYYHTGTKNNNSNGARDFLRLDNIFISKGKMPKSPIYFD